MLNKILKLTLIFIAIHFNAFSQAPSIQWQKCIGGSNFDSGINIKPTYDNGFILVGVTKSNNGNIQNYHGLSDAYIAKLDNLGNIEWSKTIGGTNDDILYWIEQTLDSGFIAVGHTRSNDGDISGNHGNADGWIIKFDKNGNIVWSKCVGGFSDEEFTCIRKTIDSGFIILGTTYSSNGDLTGIMPNPNNFLAHLWQVKIDNIGSIQWQKVTQFNFGSQFVKSVNSKKIIQSLDSGYLYTFETNHSTPNHRWEYTYFVKSKANNAIDWEKIITLDLVPDSARGEVDILQDIDSNFYLFYKTTVPAYPISYSINKIKKSNKAIWTNIYYTESNFNYIKTADIINSNKIIMGGYTYGSTCKQNNQQTIINCGPTFNHDTTGKTTDVWIVCVDTAGNLNWQKCYGGSNNDYLNSIHFINDSSYIGIGSTLSTNGDVIGNNGGSDIWIIKLNNSVLPLKMMSYELKMNTENSTSLRGRKISVENIWTTATEINVSHFNIQRSTNSKDFITIGKVKAYNKNFNEYSFIDQLITKDQDPKTLYYRIESVDFDGKKQYSEIRNVELGIGNNELRIFPNPAKDFVTIECKGAKELLIIDYLGRIVFQSNNKNEHQTINTKPLF